MDQLISHPEVGAFLQGYPQAQWLTVLKATLLYGISSLKALKAAGLPVDVLELGQREEPARPGVANIKGKLQDMKTQIEEIDKFLGEAPGFQAQQQAPPTRSCSVPKTKQPLGPVYPDWWPKDTSVAPAPKPKPKAKPPKTRPNAKPDVPAPAPQLKPAMKTTGTSTALVQPPFRMNYMPRQTSKPLKSVAFRANQPEITEEFPEEQAGLRPQSASPLSSSTREQRPKRSQPDAERQTVKRQAQWMGDFSDVVKRSPLKSSSGASEPVDAARKYETSSASSISTYHPSEELKAFYRNEHEKIFAEPTRLKTLAPRELSLDPAAQVSMSAQLYRMSGSSGESEEEQMDSFSRS